MGPDGRPGAQLPARARERVPRLTGCARAARPPRPRPRRCTDAVTGAQKEYFFFDDIRTTPYAPGETELNLLALSRNLPDIRAGHDGAGADGDVVRATRSIKLSAARQKEWGN